MAGRLFPVVLLPVLVIAVALASTAQPRAEAGVATDCTLAIGKACAWGSDAVGQIANGADESANQVAPDNVEGLPTNTIVIAVSAGANHTLALLSDGTVRSWGDDLFGQLGNGAPKTSSAVPVTVKNTNNAASLTNVKAIDAGANHSLALLANGTVVAWGADTSGQLGNDNNLFDFSFPQPVASLSNVVSISGGEAHSLAVLKSGGVRSWGDDTVGQLGDGAPSTNQRTPVIVSNINNAASVSAGAAHSMALLKTGAVHVWAAICRASSASAISRSPTAVAFNVPTLPSRTPSSATPSPFPQVSSTR
jgi:alpha-tubulin suppressor-like RCC1 family protein